MIGQLAQKLPRIMRQKGMGKEFSRDALEAIWCHRPYFEAETSAWAVKIHLQSL